MRNTSLREVAAKTPAWVLGLAWGVILVLIIVAQGTGEQLIISSFRSCLTSKKKSNEPTQIHCSYQFRTIDLKFKAPAY